MQACCGSDLIEAYDVGVVQFLHAGDLSGQQPLGLLIQLGFVQDLYGHFVWWHKGRRLKSMIGMEK